MFLKKAMRYYRLWIYTCNAVLLVSVLVFLGVTVGILTHPYLALVPTPPLYHPSLLYGYVALFLQAGILQTIGCLGARRLCQKLLNTYWFLLLSLLIGDVIVGLVWIIKFRTLTDGVPPYLNMTLKNDYGKDYRFTDIWDEVQSAHDCCGVGNPYDYYKNASSTILPWSCCKMPTDPVVSELRAGMRKHQKQTYATVPLQKPTPEENKEVIHDEIRKLLKNFNISCREDPLYEPNLDGCGETIKSWYKDSAETLMILGFCVTTFIKMCFVGILRFEIQEMIQKIKVLQGETVMTPNPELAAALGMIPQTERKVEANLVSNAIVEEETTKETPVHLQKHNHIMPHSDGADSDTNSHCALITDTPIRNAHPTKRNGNNNELTELRELRHVRQTQI